ncbi:MAG: hypothetical protein FJ291_28780 [Planctomycetes bacterium]|nr:hypothetical protein [Planctomycetota bacterium]
MIRWLARLRDIDRRWLYLATAVALAVPFVARGRIAMPPTEPFMVTRRLFDAIEACPPDKVVLIDSSWNMGSQAENEAQLECVVRHLCRRRVRFVVISVGVTELGPEFARQVIEPIAAEAGRQYGTDWVNLGYVQAGGDIKVLIEALCRDLHAVRPTDVHDTPVAQLPLMRSVRSINDAHLLFSVTYSPTADWISLVKGQFGTPVAFGCMTIMSPYYHTFIESGQLSGMLVGNWGAAEYERLTQARGKGTERIAFATYGNCAILAAILLGNLGLWAARRTRGRTR